MNHNFDMGKLDELYFHSFVAKLKPSLRTAVLSRPDKLNNIVQVQVVNALALEDQVQTAVKKALEQKDEEINALRTDQNQNRNHQVRRNDKNNNFGHCFRCGQEDHKADKCWVQQRNIKCNKCDRIGHLAKVCRSGFNNASTNSKK
jgi:hypothetical protein